MRKLALVLGGGATKGYAHIGVLKVLEQNGIKPDLIVGTSMGAIIGGLYASGISIEHLIEISNQMKRKKVVDFNLFNIFFKDSILSGKKLNKLLYQQVQNTTHDQTQIPFIATATNIQDGKLEILNDGTVFDSMLASSAIPGVFPPIEKEGKVLCDGGLMDNVPDDIAKKYGKNHVVLSVDVIADYKKQVETSRIKIMGLTINALTLMQTQITKLKGNNSDLRISISQPDVAQMSFDAQSIQKSIVYGEKTMKKNITKIKKLLED